MIEQTLWDFLYQKIKIDFKYLHKFVIKWKTVHWPIAFGALVESKFMNNTISVEVSLVSHEAAFEKREPYRIQLHQLDEQNMQILSLKYSEKSKFRNPQLITFKTLISYFQKNQSWFRHSSTNRSSILKINTCWGFVKMNRSGINLWQSKDYWVYTHENILWK